MNLVDATIETLRRHLPFGAMAAEDLRALAGQLKLAYFARGTPILEGGSAVDRLLIVKDGWVQGEPPAALRGEKLVGLAHGPGEMFPVGAILARRASAYRYEASTDVFAWEIGAAEFQSVLARSPELLRFCTGHLASLLAQSQREQQARAAETLVDEGRMLQPLHRLTRSAPLSCSPDTPIRSVLRLMDEKRVGSMVVAAADGVPSGIFTQPDALSRVALAGADLDAPISGVMTAAPVVISRDATAHDGALAMARHGIRHLVLVDGEGRLAGVVSERDLFALQRVGLRRTADRIRAAGSAAALAEAARDVRELAGTLLAQGAGAEQLMQIVGALNDAIVQRATEVAGTRIAGRWCWIALGSEGRAEQTLATDQDNALIVERAQDLDAALAFAAEVNRTLADCGFPLCTGEIMARNPRWCLTPESWRAAFAGWIRNPGPDALLQSAIFFDLRALAGERGLAADLHRWLLEEVAGNDAFLRGMAANAVQTRPPLGLFGIFATGTSAGGAAGIDLKKFGVRLFVDSARVWALAHGIAETSTVERLRAAGRLKALPSEEADAAAEAFLFLQSLRLRRQQFDRPAPGEENWIAPEALNELDRRVLKEVFRAAAKLQARLRLDYGL